MVPRSLCLLALYAARYENVNYPVMKQKISRRDVFARVYLAGKIQKNDWRHSIFPELRTAELLNGVGRVEALGDGLTYAGPYFVSCGHGCAHGEGDHGRGSSEKGCFVSKRNGDLNLRMKVAKNCLKSLDSATFVFCWIEDFTAFGTLFELGYARAMNKPTFVAIKKRTEGNELNSDLWFCLTQAQKWIESESPISAWAEFKLWQKKRKQVADHRKEFKPMTVPQRRYLYDLIERTEGLEIVDEGMLLAIDVNTAGAMIDCFTTGGDPVREFGEIFEWEIEEPDDANSDRPISPVVNFHYAG
jgi:hypothetical protein